MPSESNHLSQKTFITLSRQLNGVIWTDRNKFPPLNHMTVVSNDMRLRATLFVKIKMLQSQSMLKMKLMYLLKMLMIGKS